MVSLFEQANQVFGLSSHEQLFVSDVLSIFSAIVNADVMSTTFRRGH